MNITAMSIFALALIVLAVADWYVWQTQADDRPRRFQKLLRS
jgi:F0F1-type ATP synthase membrane subunit a